MALVLAHKRPGLLTQAGRVELSESYFHPAYLVKNGILAFQEQVLNVPQAKFGLEDRPMSDIIIIDSDGEEQESHAADDPNPMLPPFKYTWENYKNIPRRGRPNTRRKRSRGAASSWDGGAPVVRNAIMAAEDTARLVLEQFDLDCL
jgi:hypothetical protein